MQHYGFDFLSSSVPTMLPSQAQIIDQKSFNALPTVPPPSEANGTRVGTTLTHQFTCAV